MHGINEVAESRGAGDLPAWPSSIECVYGWRSLSLPLHLKSAMASGHAEYEVTLEALETMNLVTPGFFVNPEVQLRVDFGTSVLVSEPFSIGRARPHGPGYYDRRASSQAAQGPDSLSASAVAQHNIDTSPDGKVRHANQLKLGWL